MTAREALEKSRATVAHGYGHGGIRSERLCDGMKHDDPTFCWAYSQYCEGASLDLVTGHCAVASLLLDGFSIEELTEAGG